MTKKPPLDPPFAAIVEQLATLPSISSVPLEMARNAWDPDTQGAPEPVAHIRDLSIPVQGASIPARLYRPNDNPNALLVYYHGGGFVLGDLQSHDVALRVLANRTGAAVLSVAYRLAPENPFPVGLEDCYAALLWAKEQIRDVAGGDKPLLIGGDSAGGNLAAVVALLARDRKGPKIACQILVYPTIDGRCDTPSFTEHATGSLLTSNDMRWFWSQYIADERQRVNPLASPCMASSHRDLGPAIVVIAEYDPLRDEGDAYAKSLRSAGNPVTVLRYDTLPHGFMTFLNVSEAANAAFAEIADHVREAIAQTGA